MGPFIEVHFSGGKGEKTVALSIWADVIAITQLV